MKIRFITHFMECIQDVKIKATQVTKIMVGEEFQYAKNGVGKMDFLILKNGQSTMGGARNCQ